jgi:hypothetical protein
LARFFFFAGLARGLDAWILAGSDQALDVVGGRLEGGADFVDGGAWCEAQDVPADRFLEAFVRLVFEDGDFGEQVERARIHGGADAVGAGRGWLSGSSHGGTSPTILYRP